MLRRLFILVFCAIAVAAAIALPALSDSRTLTAVILAVEGGSVVVALIIGIFRSRTQAARDISDAPEGGFGEAVEHQRPEVMERLRRLGRGRLAETQTSHRIPPSERMSPPRRQLQARSDPVPLAISILVGFLLIALGVFDLYLGGRLPWPAAFGLIVSGAGACGVRFFFPEGLLRALRVLG